MQQQARHEDVGEDELNEVKAQLSIVEKDRNRAFEELRETKLRLSKISSENNEELRNVKESLQNVTRELNKKEKTIASLQIEVEKVKQLEIKLLEKDDALLFMKEQLSLSKVCLSEKDALLSDRKAKLEELEDEIGKRKESEANLFNSFVNQTNQLQEASFLIEKHRLKEASLREKMEALEEDTQLKDKSTRKEVERLQNEVTVVKDGGKSTTIEIKTKLNEIDFLKNELKRAMEAEETKGKAMEDLALALKEVALESKRTKEKLISSEQQIEALKEEAVKLKKIVKYTEGTSEALLKEQKKENVHLTNIVNRLRLEADESISAWSEKETQFVKCIKKVEAENRLVLSENNRLMKLTRNVDEISGKSEKETKQLRDMLNKALNDVNMAKEAESHALSEITYLKDFLVEKDKALVSLAQETERLRINEAEANDSIRELKRVFTFGSKKEVAKLVEEGKEMKKAAKRETGADTPQKEPRERKLSNTFSFDLNQLWPSLPGTATKSSKDFDEDANKDDVLGGSIFDLVESPEKDPPPYHRRTSSACSSTDDKINLAFENFDDDAHFDDMEIDRSSHVKKKALLRRFGDLLRRKNSHPPKDLPQPPPKEVSHSQKEIIA